MVCETMKVERRGEKEFLIDSIDEMRFIGIQFSVESNDIEFDDHQRLMQKKKMNAVLVPILVWLQVNWLLAYVIAVLESKFGFEALRKSENLLKRKRWIASYAMLSDVLLMGLLVVTHSGASVMVGVAQGSLVAIFGVVAGSFMMNHYLLENVALYMYCKDEFFNGEKLPLEIGHKFTGASEYVSMPMADEKNHATV
ncbi:hypothetical protein H5410_024994 [Solanum commersonii]|uniref:Uncharacterized protein n=1 Tax=Solanum commersonii TaxID=4109 RepID=A0A9J5YX95_SOLCO|nr:hypothetical protein H5410_024994 [Solanum commersonii]